MYTYQDFEKASNKEQFILDLVNSHMASPVYRTAVTADLYNRQCNETINKFIRIMYSASGTTTEDYTSSNHRLCNNLFHRLNTQRCVYSLGNGVSFTDHKESREVDGKSVTVDLTKEMLGNRFDTDFKKLAYKALIHGVSFGYWNSERLYVFPVTQFAPLMDETDGSLRAGVRFWRLDDTKPMYLVLYEEDGYTKYAVSPRTGKLELEQTKTSYIVTTQYTNADGEVIVGEDNYSSLPVIPMWGNDLKQSTLIGMRQSLDAIDLIRSGFANDLSDCAEIYWLVENYGGMSNSDLEKFRDRLKTMHIAEINTEDGGRVSAQTQELPYQARETFLGDIRNAIYEDFGALDVHTIAAGATNDHIDAAYQSMDEEADDFEYQCIEFIQQLLKLEGIEDTPVFKRNRISNQKEQVDMILACAEYLDEETILQKLPFISVDEVSNIMEKVTANNMDRMLSSGKQDEENEENASPAPQEEQ